MGKLFEPYISSLGCSPAAGCYELTNNVLIFVIKYNAQALVVLEVSFMDGSSVLETICQCVFCWQQGWQHFNRYSKFLHNLSWCFSFVIIIVRTAASGLMLNESELLVEEAVSIYCRCLVKSSGHIFSAVLAADIYEGSCHPSAPCSLFSWLDLTTNDHP